MMEITITAPWQSTHLRHCLSLLSLGNQLEAQGTPMPEPCPLGRETPPPKRQGPLSPSKRLQNMQTCYHFAARCDDRRATAAACLHSILTKWRRSARSAKITLPQAGSCHSDLPYRELSFCRLPQTKQYLSVSTDLDDHCHSHPCILLA